MKLSYLPTMLIGLLLIAVITPLSQFLTIMTVNSDMETALPMGWAVGTLFALVLVLLPLRLMRDRGMPRPQLVIIYTMLTIAVPVMNIGMVRQLYMTLFAVPNEYLNNATGTYRTAYNAMDDDWFPVIPDTKGLAWNQSDRLLRLLRDDEVIQKRGTAKSQFLATVSLAGERLKRGTELGELELNTDELRRQIAVMGMDEVQALQRQVESNPAAGAAVRALDLNEALTARLEMTRAASAKAADRLPDMLEEVSELAVSLLPMNYQALQLSERDRIDRAMGMLERNWPQRHERILEQVRALQRPVERDAPPPPTDPTADRAQRGDIAAAAAIPTPRWRVMRNLVTRLGRADYVAVRDALIEQRLARLSGMSEAQFRALRADFVFRLGRDERQRLWSQTGESVGAVNLNLAGFLESAWTSVPQRNQRDRQTVSENLRTVIATVPWQIWARPLVMWSVLFLSIFLLMMCLAEWFRRKWIERENLAFPLVDIADHLLRHDAALEVSEDPTRPHRRDAWIHPLLIVGMVIGFGWLSLEALYHYGFTNTELVTTLNVSETILTQGFLKSMNKVFFVLSPIVLGIAFLVSLEISLSVWVIFIIMSLVWAVAGDTQSIKDPLETGWGGGRDYPFVMEQMLGAALCFAAILVWKMVRGRSAQRQLPTTDIATAETASPKFIPTHLAIAGSIGLPVIIVALLWTLGLDGWAGLVLTGLFLLIMFGEVIAATRVRAETGLPSHWVSYTFVKIPIVLGLTEFTGADRFIAFILISFVPGALLMRSLGQHLENIELARRHRMAYGPIAAAGLLAFLVATGVGMLSYLLFSYYIGEAFSIARPSYSDPGPFNVARYPLWVSHFLGEAGLTQFDEIHDIRIWFLLIGAVIFGGLTLLRNRFLKFPLHPMGYLILLISSYFWWVSFYGRPDVPSQARDTSWLWGSIFIAWLVKFLLVKYGGMNMYKRAKPLFIGLVLGSVVCIFAWNVLDLGCSIIAAQPDFQDYGENTQAFVKTFTDKAPYSPYYY